MTDTAEAVSELGWQASGAAVRLGEAVAEELLR